MLVLYGYHRVAQPGGGLGSGVPAVVQREDSVRALLGVTHARQRGHVDRTRGEERHDQSGRDRPEPQQPPAGAARAARLSPGSRGPTRPDDARGG